MSNKSLLLILLFAGSQANALIIEQSGDGLDWQYDDVSGLQWLDLTYTDNMTVSFALETYTGWEVANQAQFTDMYSQYTTFGGSTVLGYSCDTVDNQPGYDLCYGSGDTGFVNNLFTDHFGTTDFGDFDDYMIGSSYGIYTEGAEYRVGGTLFREYAEMAAVEYIESYYDFDTDYSPYVSDRNHLVGTFLVRSVDVPEPASIALMSLGLAGLVLGRRRRRS